MKITEGLYGYTWNGMENNCNTFLLRNDKLTLIDPGHRGAFDVVESQIRADGFEIEDVDLVLVTHCHPDHIEAAEYVCAQSGARFAMHHSEYAFATTIGAQLARMLGMELPELEPTFLLRSGELVIGFEDPIRLKVIHTPGHSPGSVCFYWEERRALITGDLIFAQSVGRTDFPGGDPAKLKHSIERVSRLDVEHVLPGHGPNIEGKDNVRGNYALIKEYFFSPGSRF